MSTRTGILQAEFDARKASDMAYDAAKTEWESVRDQWQAMRGGGVDGDFITRIAALVRKFGPKLATRMGYPGAAAGLTALLANDGGFSGILGSLKGLFGF